MFGQVHAVLEKEGITAELTIYRGGAETFEAMAAAADVILDILDASSLTAAGRKKGVMSKVVANAAMGYYGWQLMVLAKSPLRSSLKLNPMPPMRGSLARESVVVNRKSIFCSGAAKRRRGAVRRVR
jgi:hypothetical protein